MAGTACDTGNQLDVFFLLPALQINSAGSTSSVYGQKDFELLEDDGATDLIGNLSTYSYNRVSAVPEPSTLLLLGSGVALLPLFGFRRRRRMFRTH